VPKASLSTDVPAERWVSIRRAAELVGVNQATLRQWGDAGRVRTFVTPGGHRRFLEQDLVSLTQTPEPTERGPSLPELLLATRERYESLGRRRLGENEWFRSFDESALRRFRILGGLMLTLVATYLTAGRRDRERALAKGRDVASEYGSETARLGLSVSEATKAFLTFRTPILEGINRWLREHPTAPREADEVHRRANHFMDQVLLSMASAHESYQPARASGAQP
jgi:hypothetical protein